MPPSDEAGPSQVTGAPSSPAKLKVGQPSTSPYIRESNVISEFNKKSDTAFATQYLTLLPEHFRTRHKVLMRKFHAERNKMGTSGGSLDEGQKYSCMIAMLNYASAMVHEHIQVTHQNKRRLQFIDTHTSPLSHHPKKYVDKPDFCAVEADLIPTLTISPKGYYMHVPWHKTESVGEMKPSTEDAKKATQGMRYAGSHNVARPDRPGCYALSASPKGYQIGWSDPSGIHISETIAWDYEKGDLLLRYVYSLYIPPSLCDVLDPTITLADRTTDDSPLWNIQFKGKSYTNGRTVFVGEPWSRQTAIYKFKNNDVVTMIKDQFEHVGRRFQESELYHKLEGAAGWVTFVDSCDVGLTIGSDASARVKKRLLMSSGGEALDKVPTTKMFLMSMYDILEAHRYGVMKKHVMHRDISHRNILVNPFGIPAEGPAEPTFVSTILDSSGKLHPPVALLCDLDNGCVYGEEMGSDIILEQLKSRTGTPMYIARAVESGRLLNASSPVFEPMPELSSKAIAKRYAECYKGDAMRTFRDKEGTWHGGTPDIPKYKETRVNDDQATTAFYHQPRHDVESVGWCIIAFCLRSQPKDEKVEQSLELLHKAWGFLTQSGNRGDVLGMTLQDWERALHPRLKFFGMFLFRLCEQMTPEYGFLSPPPPEDHLHEAFQRLILNQIDEMAEDIELDTEKLREVPELRQQKHQATTTSFGPSLGQSSSSPSKRQSTKRSAPSEGKPTATPQKRAKKESSRKTRKTR
ncbi:uncharacterized protein ARMOST_03363 [Armillaria ostoyae]|uniref:Fungal-type protein kinase domain-containing protein n=1 Tax=Armillaria ostoyae TaxID=47428 RepID=A0A284QUH5_ARMOS|nr:uncharacterized protein ARMOST_03363 [Armillaria ostoyae]